MAGVQGMAGRAGRAARRSVFSVCSQQADEGDTLAIITVRACSPTNESRSTCARPRRASPPAPCRGCSARGAAREQPARRRARGRHLGELGAAEGHMARDAVQRADALLERQQALVDLGALQPRLPARARAQPGLGAAPRAHAAPCWSLTAAAHTRDLCLPAVQTRAPVPEHVRARVGMLTSSRPTSSGNAAQHLPQGWRPGGRAPVVLVRVGAALAAGQVDERDLADLAPALALAPALQRKLRACGAGSLERQPPSKHRALS